MPHHIGPSLSVLLSIFPYSVLPPVLFACDSGAALGAQVHALNLLRSFVTSSPEVAACDVLSAAAAADGAVRYSWRCNIGDYSSIDDSSTGDNSNNNSSTTRCPQPTGATGILFEGRTAQSVSPSICLTAGARDVEIFKVSAHPGSSSPMTLSAAALAISIQTISSTDFPVRSAASSLQVATTKRLAGTDDEVRTILRANVAPPSSFPRTYCQ